MSTKTTFNHILHFWPIVAAILAVAVAVGASSVRIATNEAHVEKLETETYAQSQRIARLEQAVEQLPEIRQDIKELLRRVQ